MACLFYGCENYKKALELSKEASFYLKDSLTQANQENSKLKDSLDKIFKFYQEELSIKNNEIKKLEDSLLFYSNIKQIRFDKWIFDPGSIFEEEHNYKILRQKGSAFYGAQNASDFFIYSYENFQIFNSDNNKICFEISYLNKDGRGIWVKSFVDDRLPLNSFTYIFYDSLTKEFQDFYENNFLEPKK